jgi:hypothetical protein
MIVPGFDSREEEAFLLPPLLYPDRLQSSPNLLWRFFLGVKHSELEADNTTIYEDMHVFVALCLDTGADMLLTCKRMFR